MVTFRTDKGYILGPRKKFAWNWFLVQERLGTAALAQRHTVFCFFCFYFCSFTVYFLYFLAISAFLKCFDGFMVFVSMEQCRKSVCKWTEMALWRGAGCQGHHGHLDATGGLPASHCGGQRSRGQSQSGALSKDRGPLPYWRVKCQIKSVNSWVDDLKFSNYYSALIGSCGRSLWPTWPVPQAPSTAFCWKQKLVSVFHRVIIFNVLYIRY